MNIEYRVSDSGACVPKSGERVLERGLRYKREKDTRRSGWSDRSGRKENGMRQG